MTENSETYPRSFIPAEAGCYVYPASRVTKCIRRQSPFATLHHQRARAPLCPLTASTATVPRVRALSRVALAPTFSIFFFFFSLKKKRKNATLLKASGFFFSFCSRVFSFEPFSWYVIMRICVI